MTDDERLKFIKQTLLSTPRENFEWMGEEMDWLIQKVEFLYNSRRRLALCLLEANQKLYQQAQAARIQYIQDQDYRGYDDDDRDR